MDLFFVIVTVIGLAFLSFVVADSKSLRNKLRKQLHPAVIASKFHSDEMQKLFKNAGWEISSKNYNLFRFFGFFGFLAIVYLNAWFRGDLFPQFETLIALILLLSTSTFRFAPMGIILHWLHNRNIIRKDGELISFFILYEKNRKRSKGYLQFSEFCKQRAIESKYLQSDLLILVRRIDEEGLEKAMDWFVSRFPNDHPFVKDIRSIILAVEGMNDTDAAAKYLEDQSKIISGICSDVYTRKWKLLGDVANIFTTVPAMLIFLMAVVIVFQYTEIIKQQINTFGG